jgi:hypothetical protein
MKSYNCFQNVNMTSKDCCSILWWCNVCGATNFTLESLWTDKMLPNWCHYLTHQISPVNGSATIWATIIISIVIEFQFHVAAAIGINGSDESRTTTPCYNEREAKAIWSWNNIKLLLTKRGNNSSARAHLHRKMTV